MAGAALAMLGVFTAVHVLSAASAGKRGRSALSRAEADLSARELASARRNLVTAHQSFTDTRAELDALGPIAAVARVIPVLGSQVKAVDAFSSAGLDVSEAGQQLVDAADVIVHPPDRDLPIAAAMDALRVTQQSLRPAVAAVTEASEQIGGLEGRFLIGPLARIRDDLARRLPRIQARAASAERGLAALLLFAGDRGPKR